MKRFFVFLLILGLVGISNGAEIHTGSVSSSGATGDVTGPSFATDGGIACFDGTGGKTLKDCSARTDTPSTLTLYEATSDGDNKVTVTAPAKGVGLSGDVTFTIDATGTAASIDATQTFTNKTFDASATGNVLKQAKTVWLTNPQRCDETGALMDTTKTNATFGLCQFSNSAAKAGNYAIYKWAVPPDIDTSIDLTGRLYFRLGNTDTGKHSYEVSVSSIASSASADGSFGNAVTFNFGGDGSGAQNDLEIFPDASSAATTLTGWKSALTANQMVLIKWARSGDDGTNDTSTVNSYGCELVITYGSTL